MLLANFISSFNNSISIKKEFVDVNYSILILNCLNILVKNGYILGFKILNKRIIRIYLKYYKGVSVIKYLKILSTPGFRKYIKLKNLLKLKNLDFLVISTSKGIISSNDIILNLKEKYFKNSYNITDSLININNIVFHKNIILKSYYRSNNILYKFNWYLLKKKKLDIKKFYYYFFIKNNKINNVNFFDKIKLLNLLNFFDFNSFFFFNTYLKFTNILNFKSVLLSINKNKFQNVFYFFINLKFIYLINYKYKFSLYIKYINHLININQPIKKNLIKNFNMGGELLFLVK